MYLIDGITGVDLLISASDHDECTLWRSLIVKHIEFANKYPAEIAPPVEDSSYPKRRFSLFSVCTSLTLFL